MDLIRGRTLHGPNDLVILCPDCGEHVAFRNRCPKCASDTWITRGLVREVFKGVDLRVWRWRNREDGARKKIMKK